VQSPERRGRKLADAEALAAMIRSDRLLKPDVPERLNLDTSALAPEEATVAIEVQLSSVAARGRLAPADARHLTLVDSPCIRRRRGGFNRKRS